MNSRILEVFALCFALALKANAQTPTITSEPQSATNNVASAADFTVVATNAATYQWYFQGANSLADATNATLSLDDLSTNQAGSYTVVVTSSNNISVTSAPPAVLTVVQGTIIQWTISGYPGGGGSNFLVALFDHDKPATVENFIHYITSGAYSNMFFDRDVTNFVLQGGDYVSLDRTTNGLNVTNVTVGTNFPTQVYNEYGAGPRVGNTFGTLAMALVSGETNSATSAFFFNETNNSPYLDNQDFTVFGRILFGTNSGSNVLQYFNTLSAPSNGLFAYSLSNLSIPDLPVNYDGTNEPADDNLFYCSFAFVTPPPVDATPPTVAIATPSNNMVFTNPGTLIVQGTASDNVGLAEVFCVLTPPTGPMETNAATGTTNWSVSFGYLEQGVYQLTAYAEDGAGNLSAPVTETFTASIPSGTLVQITFSGFPDGSSSNVLVQLFDQEKPATVANFLHYVNPVLELGIFRTVAYNNMVWDRCVPGFILQGGDYDAPDQTVGNPVQDLTSIASEFTDLGGFYSPEFAGQVDNEFNVGPVIHNTFGTLAMSKSPGYPDSAANSFFINLADNSTNLDNQDGGYTVFGQVVSGSNVLQYFNTLSKPRGGIFDGTTVSTNSSLPNLPVNYSGWGAPANSNLFFGSFTLLSNYKAETNPPTITVSSPTNGQTVANPEVMVTGTASDNVGVANVACYCSGSNYNGSVYAIGTTNWTANLGVLAPGTYTNMAVAQNGAGVTYQASNVFVVPSFPFQIETTGNGTFSPSLTASNTTLGTIYTVTAKPGKGVVFVNWVSGTNVTIDPTLEFIAQNGQQITANFITNNVPAGVSITYPAPNAGLTNNTFSITGKLASNFKPTLITCQVFSASTIYAVTTNMVIPAAETWSTPSLSLSPGSYYLQVLAEAAGGRASLVIHEFSIEAPLTVIVYGQSRPFIPNGTFLRVGTQYTQGVNPGRGQSFVSWNNGSYSFTTPAFAFVMTPGLTFTLTLVSNTESGKFTLSSPAANSQVTSPSIILGGKTTSSAVATQVVCQLYQNNQPLTGFMPAAIAGTSWTLPVSNLTMGLYNAVAIATGAAGNTSLASGQFTVNFFPNIAGTYKGLFFDPAAVSLTNAGSLSLRLTSASPANSGKYGLASGTLTLPSRSYSFSVSMANTGTASVQPNGFAGTLTMYFDVTNFSGQVTGSVSQGGESSPLIAFRPLAKLSADTVPSLGHYALSLEPQTPTNADLDGPPGDSFAAVTVAANGNLAVAGDTADDSAFSQSTGVFTNGVWPLFASFYKGKGMLIGWETNWSSGECAGTLYWIKSSGNGAYDSGGVDEQLNSIGTNYIQPASGVPYQIVFGGGTLTTLVTNEFSFSAAGKMNPAAGTTDKLTGSLVLTTGVLKGSILNPFTSKTLDFTGVFPGPSEGGGGFTLDAGGQTGYFDITPVPAQ